jgi:predicted outer membrane repeat protein
LSARGGCWLRAGYKGGGLCVTGQSLKLTMSAATFSHNEARFGGAIFGHQASEVRLANCSFEENGWLPSTALTLPDSESYAVGGALALEAAATTQV